MAYIGRLDNSSYDPNDWIKKTFGGLGQMIGGSLEMRMLAKEEENKAELEKAAKEQAFQEAMMNEGYEPYVPEKMYSPYVEKRELGTRGTWAKEPTKMEVEKFLSDQAYKKAQMEGLGSESVYKSAQAKALSEKTKKGDLKRLPSQAAGMVAMADIGVKNVQKLKNMFFKQDPKTGKPILDNETILQMSAPMGGYGEKGREAYSLIYDAVEAKLRAETGAAAQKSEVDRIAKRYIPRPAILGGFGDTPATVKSKLDRLEEFLSETKTNILKGNADANDDGGVVMEDANGNRAIVYPDGSFEEVK